MNKWDTIFEKDPNYKPLNDVFLAKLLQKIKKETNQKPKTMVDLGCGTARTIFQFAERGFDVTGIDYSRIALRKLRQRVDDSDFKNITLTHNDLNNITVDLAADIFLCNFVYAFIEEKDTFLQKIAESMSDNSSFIIVTPVTHKDMEYVESDKIAIAVDYDETMSKFKGVFSSVEDYHHDYIGFREDYVTFILKK